MPPRVRVATGQAVEIAVRQRASRCAATTFRLRFLDAAAVRSERLLAERPAVARWLISVDRPGDYPFIVTATAAKGPRKAQSVGHLLVSDDQPVIDANTWLDGGRLDVRLAGIPADVEVGDSFPLTVSARLRLGPRPEAVIDPLDVEVCVELLAPDGSAPECRRRQVVTGDGPLVDERLLVVRPTAAGRVTALTTVTVTAPVGSARVTKTFEAVAPGERVGYGIDQRVARAWSAVSGFAASAPGVWVLVLAGLGFAGATRSRIRRRWRLLRSRTRDRRRARQWPLVSPPGGIDLRSTDRDDQISQFQD